MTVDNNQSTCRKCGELVRAGWLSLGNLDTYI